MEIASIDKIQTVRKPCALEKNQASVEIEDTLTISSDAQKKAEWVQKLRQMPDVRAEKIEAALASDAVLSSAAVRHEVIRQLLNS